MQRCCISLAGLAERATHDVIGQGRPGKQEALHELIVFLQPDEPVAVGYHPKGQHGLAGEATVTENFHALQKIGQVDLIMASSVQLRRRLSRTTRIACRRTRGWTRLPECPCFIGNWMHRYASHARQPTRNCIICMGYSVCSFSSYLRLKCNGCRVHRLYTTSGSSVAPQHLMTKFKINRSGNEPLPSILLTHFTNNN